MSAGARSGDFSGPGFLDTRLGARSKGVIQTHQNLFANVMNGWNTAKTRRIGDMTLIALPLAHTFGLSALLSGFLFATHSVLMRWFAPEEALELIEKHRVKAMSGVPTMFVSMMNHPNASKYDTSSVERWLVGAAPMPVAQLEEFEQKFGGTMYVGYGLTESCPGVAVEREDMPRKPGSTGVVMEGVTVQILADDGTEAPRGEIGEILVSGDNVSPVITRTVKPRRRPSAAAGCTPGTWATSTRTVTSSSSSARRTSSFAAASTSIRRTSRR